MGRPKFSKNKSKDVFPTPVEFNYEEQTSESYVNVNAATTSMPQIASVAQEEYEYSEQSQTAMMSSSSTPNHVHDKLFLIVGNVRLDPAGRAPITAEQTRLVFANDFNQAVAKFSTYFAELSNAAECYTVIGATGSEAIR